MEIAGVLREIGSDSISRACVRACIIFECGISRQEAGLPVEGGRRRSTLFHRRSEKEEEEDDRRSVVERRGPTHYD